MSENLSRTKFDFDVPAHTVYLTKHGSQAYGTNLPTSDLDFKGFAVAPEKVVVGFAYEFNEQETKPEDAPEGTPPEEIEDKVIYDLRKFCSLATKCNPNIIEVLFVDESDIVFLHPAGKLIRDHREEFLSKTIRSTFSGYAFAQLKRIKTHRSWLMKPPPKKPERADFGAVDNTVNAEKLGAFDKLVEQGVQFTPNVMALFSAERQYQTALRDWNSYQTWKRERNEARSKLEAEHGYDTKHAMHLVRLLRMCREILSGKGVIVKRPDREELLAIRRGEWSYDRLIAWAEQEDAETKKLIETSSLPESVDLDRLNDLCIEAHHIFWNRRSV
jgi:predicted nucleotidyltransferase